VFFASIPLVFTGEAERFYTLDTEAPADSNGLPVLVVEDNREELFIYERCLKDSQFQLVPARTIKDARRILRNIRPVTIILDVLLRGEHSWDLLQELKQNPETSNIPVVVVTVVDNRDKALALGADAFHTKPVERAWLLQHLNSVASQNLGRQILLIDDDEASRYLVKSALGRTDFRFLEARDGHEGLRKAEEETPDAVVLDLSMPDISGFEVLARLKKNAHTASIPVIIHTSKVLDPHEREALSQAVAIVSKENSSRELLLEQLTSAFQNAGVPIEVR
jgi:CheY-like chemotaxis protein